MSFSVVNIFYVDSHPYNAAISLCDKHVVKMILESAQLLCTAHHMCPNSGIPDEEVVSEHTGAVEVFPYTSVLYRPAFVNHPSCVWTRSSIQNYQWLVHHATSLCGEYTHRYGKTHKTWKLIEQLWYWHPDIPDSGFSPPPQCMPDEHKHDDTVQAYRNYYNENKRHEIKCTWKDREEPSWWKNYTSC